MLEIIQIVDKKYRKEFVQLPLKMYKGNRYFVPPFYADEMAMFTDKNIYSKMCDHAFFIAKRDGKVVGRIQGIIQKNTMLYTIQNKLVSVVLIVKIIKKQHLHYLMR